MDFLNQSNDEKHLETVVRFHSRLDDVLRQYSIQTGNGLFADDGPSQVSCRSHRETSISASLNVTDDHLECSYNDGLTSDEGWNDDREHQFHSVHQRRHSDVKSHRESVVVCRMMQMTSLTS